MLAMWMSAKKSDDADERRAWTEVPQPGRQGEAAEEELLADGDDQGGRDGHEEPIERAWLESGSTSGASTPRSRPTHAAER